MISSKKIIIGKNEFVWIAVSGQKRIPARVDTGARTTAIWASSIRETDGILSWQFFSPESEFWTGDIFRSERFERRVVQASNGQQETRYLIPITLQLRKRRVRTHCTLANRSRQTFPILIGRNTLNGKFIVDVAYGPLELSQLDEKNFTELQMNLGGNDK